MSTTAIQDRSASVSKRKREDVDDDIALLESPTKKAKLEEKTESVTDPAPLAGEEMHIEPASSTAVNDSSTSYDTKLLEVFPSLLFAEKKLDAHYFPVTTDNPLLLVIPYIEDLKLLILTLGSVSKQTRALVFKPGFAWTKAFRRIFGSDNFNPESIEFSSEFKNYRKDFKKDTAQIAFDDTTNISPAVYVDRISQYKSKDWSFEEFDGCPLWEEDGYVDFHIDFFGDAFWYAHAEGCGRAGEYHATNDFFGEGRLIVRSKAWLKGKENIFYDEEPRSEEEDDEDEEESDDGSHSDDENEDDEDSETKEKDPKNFQEKKNEKSRLATNATEVEKEDSLAKQSELKKADDEKRAKEKLEEKRRIAQMTPKQRCLYKNFGGKLPTRSDGTETGIYLLSPDSKEIQGGRLIYNLSSNMEW